MALNNLCMMCFAQRAFTLYEYGSICHGVTQYQPIQTDERKAIEIILEMSDQNQYILQTRYSQKSFQKCDPSQSFQFDI